MRWMFSPRLRLLVLSGIAILAACVAPVPEKTKPTSSKAWKTEKLHEVASYAREQNTSGFVIAQQGEIVAEHHWEVSAESGSYYNAFLATDEDAGVAREDVASIQKSIVAVLAGFAVDRGMLDLDSAVSNYLESTSPLTLAGVTISHLLAMTSGLSTKLEKAAEPGSRWDYNTAAYSLLVPVLENIFEKDILALTQELLLEPAGMTQSAWRRRPTLPGKAAANPYGFYSTASDLAKLGMWLLSEIRRNPEGAVARAMRPSQNLNPAYGQLWWINGYPKRAQPEDMDQLEVLIPSAPGDLVAAFGYLGRRLYLVPSLDLVVARLGDEPDKDFDTQLWRRIMLALPEPKSLCVECDAPLADRQATKTEQGAFLTWREHVIDDSTLGPSDLAGGDGLAMADLDGDGYLDIVSVHESDTEYDGQFSGYVRVAWGSGKKDTWALETVAEGPEVAAAEDVILIDLNMDGHKDIVIAAELAPLLYIENPGSTRNAGQWPRSSVESTRGRGSFIRVGAGDLDGDGRPEIVAVNKGEQNPDEATPARHPISVFSLPPNPLQTQLWKEKELGRLRIPISAEVVDMDGDGDLDILAGSRGERRILWYENQGGLSFVERKIRVEGLPDDYGLTGFKLQVLDDPKTGERTILAIAKPYVIGQLWPTGRSDHWRWQEIASQQPDALVSLVTADVDVDGDLDIVTGSYSAAPRDRDNPLAELSTAAGQIIWYEYTSEGQWIPHPIVRRKRGMYDHWVVVDLDGDGDQDLVGTRGNSYPFDGVFWFEQIRQNSPSRVFYQARAIDSQNLEQVAGDQ